MIPLDIVDALLGYLARNEQVNVIIAVRRILHLNGDLRFRPRIRACGDWQHGQQERGYAQAGFPISFHGGHPFSYLVLRSTEIQRIPFHFNLFSEQFKQLCRNPRLAISEIRRRAKRNRCFRAVAVHHRTV